MHPLGQQDCNNIVAASSPKGQGHTVLVLLPTNVNAFTMLDDHTAAQEHKTKSMINMIVTTHYARTSHPTRLLSTWTNVIALNAFL